MNRRGFLAAVAAMFWRPPAPDPRWWGWRRVLYTNSTVIHIGETVIGHPRQRFLAAEIEAEVARTFRPGGANYRFLTRG